MIKLCLPREDRQWEWLDDNLRLCRDGLDSRCIFEPNRFSLTSFWRLGSLLEPPSRTLVVLKWRRSRQLLRMVAICGDELSECLRMGWGSTGAYCGCWIGQDNILPAWGWCEVSVAMSWVLYMEGQNYHRLLMTQIVNDWEFLVPVGPRVFPWVKYLS